MFVDTHCHLNSLNADTRKFVLESAGNDYRFIDSSIDLNSALASLTLSQAHSFVYSTLGFHPFSAASFHPEVITAYEDILRRCLSVVAIGEIGLDSTAEVSASQQEEVFSQFILLAKRFNLPVCVHNRQDNRRVLDILDEHYSDYTRIVFHCFSYGVDFLRRISDKGGRVSFSLNILRKNKTIIESLKNCPLESMLLETDSPYMKIKDRPSTALDVEKVYSFVSEIRNIELKELKAVIFKNAEEIFFSR